MINIFKWLKKDNELSGLDKHTQFLIYQKRIDKRYKEIEDAERWEKFKSCDVGDFIYDKNTGEFGGKITEKGLDYVSVGNNTYNPLSLDIVIIR